ncbi:MAG TPA: hypothetical protein PKY59_21025, partial [Pyrinomonadaceae bacterium]|nr:hypothetical protein [Pyrinomonadaceae bacterium]
DVKEILFQFKFYPSPLSTQHKYSIKKSFIEAANENPDAMKWVIITPQDLNKFDTEWLDQVVKESKSELVKPENPPRIEHWGHTKLINLLLKHKHIGVNYYPELFSRNGGFATIDNISIAENLCSWEMSADELTVFTKEIDLDRFYDVEADMVSFDKLSNDDLNMFTIATKVMRAKSLGKLILSPEVLYKGLISKILFSYDETKLDHYKKEIEIAEDSLLRWWIKTEESNSNLLTIDKLEIEYLHRFNDLFGKSTDPIFHITFVNRSMELVIVYNIGFNIIDIWQELGGPPTYASVVPILADVVFEIREGQKSWLKTLENAIQVPPNQAMTVKIKLKNYLNIYNSTFTVGGVFEFGTSCNLKVKSPTILICS